MIRNFNELIQEVKKHESKTISVAGAHDKEVLISIKNIQKLGLANAILIGDNEKIEQMAKEINMDLHNFMTIDLKDNEKICQEAVNLVRQGKAALPMKGCVETSTILRTVLDKKNGLRTDALISHVGLMEVEGFDRLFILSDSAVNIMPTLEDKIHIINNSVRVAHALGIKTPKVAILCAVEKANSKMPATLDAEKLTQMNENGEIEGCLLNGPLALDNAVSSEAAKHKKVNNPVAGYADILIAPNIEAGNILNKSMEYFAKAKKAGVLMGAQTPIILTSRASSNDSKLNSMLLGLLIVAMKEREI